MLKDHPRNRTSEMAVSAKRSRAEGPILQLVSGRSFSSAVHFPPAGVNTGQLTFHFPRKRQKYDKPSNLLRHIPPPSRQIDVCPLVSPPPAATLRTYSFRGISGVSRRSDSDTESTAASSPGTLSLPISSKLASYHGMSEEGDKDVDVLGGLITIPSITPSAIVFLWPGMCADSKHQPAFNCDAPSTA